MGFKPYNFKLKISVLNETFLHLVNKEKSFRAWSSRLTILNADDQSTVGTQHREHLFRMIILNADDQSTVGTQHREHDQSTVGTKHREHQNIREHQEHISYCTVIDERQLCVV